MFHGVDEASYMQADTIAGLYMAFTCGVAAYFDYKSEKMALGDSLQPAKQSALLRAVGGAMIGIFAVFLLGISVYFFSEIPIRLWEITAVFFLGSLTLRLLFRIA